MGHQALNSTRCKEAECRYSWGMRSVITRDSIYAIAIARMLSPVRPSVRLSVTRVDHRITVELRIMKLSPYGSR